MNTQSISDKGPKMKTVIGKFGVALLTIIFLTVAPAVLAQGLPYEFIPGTPARADEVTADFRYVAPKNILFISPIEGGTATDNGAALLAAVNLANLTAINGAPAAANPYLVKLAPGVYDLGIETLTMVSFVDIEGSGEGLVHNPGNGYVAEGGSKITSAAGKTVIGAANSEIRSLLVENTNASTSTGISIAAGPFRVNHVTVFDRCFSQGTSAAAGILVSNSSPVIEFATVYALEGTPNCYGIRISGTSSPIMNQVNVTVMNQGFCFGIMNYSNDPVGPKLRNVTVTATGCSVSNVALFNNNGSVTVSNSILSAGTGSFWQAAIYNTGGTPGTVNIHRSTINGAADSIQNAIAYTVNVAASQVAGTIVEANGATDEFHCANVYDASFTDITAACDAL